MALDELWAYTTTDDRDEEGVGYVETAGGTRVPLIAHSAEGARAFKLIAQRMAKLTGRAWTLRRYTAMTEVERAEP